MERMSGQRRARPSERSSMVESVFWSIIIGASIVEAAFIVLCLGLMAKKGTRDE